MCTPQYALKVRHHWRQVSACFMLTTWGRTFYCSPATSYTEGKKLALAGADQSNARVSVIHRPVRGLGCRSTVIPAQTKRFRISAKSLRASLKVLASKASCGGEGKRQCDQTEPVKRWNRIGRSDSERGASPTTQNKVRTRAVTRKCLQATEVSAERIVARSRCDVCVSDSRKRRNARRRQNR